MTRGYPLNFVTKNSLHSGLHLAANGLWGTAIILLFLFIQTWNATNVITPAGVSFVDADCYSRMTRAQMIFENPWHGKIETHSFENFPIGTHPHTTAPMDYLIATLGRLGNLDLAGAYVSPLLGALTLGALWIFAVRLRLPYRHAVTLLFAVSPILAHGFALGRPDHQSLILLLVTLGLLAEIAQGRSSKWDIAWGVVWGMALWVSLFEPLILLIGVLLTRPAISSATTFVGRFALRRSQWIALFGMVLAGMGIDGIRLGSIDPAYAQVLRRWAGTIGELHGASLPLIFSWIGWSGLLVPIGLGIAGWKGNRAAWRFLILLVAVTGITLIHARWGYFLAVIFCLSLPFAFGWIRQRWLVYPIFLVSLWPIAKVWDSRFFPDESETLRQLEQTSDFAALKLISDKLASEQVDGGILAPWWLSPALAYESGWPCVAGSSHESISGIVATAEFYLSESPQAAREILERRQVRYVMSYDADRLNSNSSQILGRRPAGPTAADQLAQAHQTFLPELQLVFANGPFRLYEWPHAKSDEDAKEK